MTRRAATLHLIPLLAIGMIGMDASAAAQEAAPAPATHAAAVPEHVQKLIASDCVQCHDARKASGDIRLDRLQGGITDETFAVWEQVANMVAVGSMPPEEAKARPTREEQDRFVAWLTPALDRYRAERLDTGGDTLIRRINHRAYRNMIQTLLGVPAQGAEVFPPDVASSGFDTVGTGLYTTAFLFDGYLECARRSLELALDRSEHAPATVDRRAGFGLPSHLVNWYLQGQLGSVLQLLKEHPDQFQQQLKQVLPDRFAPGRKRIVEDVVAAFYGEPSFAAVEAKGIAWGADAACRAKLTAAVQHELDLAIAMRAAFDRFQLVYPEDSAEDGQSFSLEVKDPGWYLISATMCASNPRRPMPARITVDNRAVIIASVENPVSEPRAYEKRVFLTAGMHQVKLGLPFPVGEAGDPRYVQAYLGARYGNNQLWWSTGTRYANPPAETKAVAAAWVAFGCGQRDPLEFDDAYPAVLASELRACGPVHESWPPPAVTSIFTRGLAGAPSAEYAQEIVARFMRRIYAEAPDPVDLRTYSGLIMAHYAAKHDFVAAVEYGLAALLSSPRFLYLDETKRADPRQRRPLRPGELARRLAYALWSDLPDEALIASAESGTLARREELLAQAHRLLADPRSRAFREAFTTQWLGIDRVLGVAISRDLFPGYDDRLLSSSVEESVAFFSELLDHDLPVQNVVDSDFAMLNSRLASAYGVPGVAGDEIRRVALPPGSHRGGVITQASVLIATGNGMVTSPVQRGAFIMERILGVHPGVPPRNVPALEATPVAGPDGKPRTARQRLAVHRERVSCARCHDRIDPLGLAFEQYDAMGGFRPNLAVLTMPTDGKPREWIAFPADLAGTTLDGLAFDGPDELKRRLLEHPERIVRAMASQLAVYVLGRGLEPSDEPVIARICADVRSHGDGLRRMLDDLLTSELFITK